MPEVSYSCSDLNIFGPSGSEYGRIAAECSRQLMTSESTLRTQEIWSASLYGYMKFHALALVE